MTDMKYMMFVSTDAEPDALPEAPGEIEDWLAGVSDGKRHRETVCARGRMRKQSKEAIVGFDILECDSLEEAIAIAARHPMARAGRLELRAFWPFE
jgi:hypothetical protein